jgi:hypothetical protein
MRDDKPLVAATVKKLPLLYAPHEEPVRFTPRKKTCKGGSEPLSPGVAGEEGSQARMARFSHPGQGGGPGLIVAPRQRGGGECVGAADIPPIRGDLPDQPQARGGLQRDRSTACTGGIEAGLFVLLGSPALAVRISGGWWWRAFIPRHAAIIAKSALSGSVVTRRDPSQAGSSRGLAALRRSPSASQHGDPPALALRRSADPASTSCNLHNYLGSCPIWVIEG